MFASADEISYTGETGAGAAIAPASSSVLRPPAFVVREPVDAIPVSLLQPAPMLNVDRTFTPAAVATIAPAQPIAPRASSASATVLPSPADTYTWLRAHWWLLAALLVLLVIAYAATRRRGSSSHTHMTRSAVDQATRNIMAKGSPEARERMAQLRAMKKAS